MKKYLLILCIILVSCKSKQSTGSSEEKPHFVKVNSNEVPSVKKNRAYDLGKRLLESCNTSRFKPFTKEEATDKVIQNATEDKITKICQKFNLRNGKFIGLNLIEITHNAENDDYLFRYKIEFEKKYFERELYVTVNSENKVSAIATKELPKKPM